MLNDQQIEAIAKLVAVEVAQRLANAAQPGVRFLRLPAVKAKTGGLSTSAIYTGMERGTFPKCFHISERTVAWLERDIDNWMLACAQQPYEPRGHLARSRNHTNEKAPSAVDGAPRAITENGASRFHDRTPNSERGAVQVGHRNRGLRGQTPSA